MYRSRAGSACVCSTTGVRRQFSVALIAVLMLAASARGDIFHLTSGGTIDGQRLETEGDQYKIRTVVGVVSVPVSAVERVEKAATPFEEYDRRVAQAGETAADQTELAAWCDEQGLRVERRKHLLRAIELNPDYAPARRALGYVRVGEMWVDGRRVIERTATSEPSENGEPAERERLARAIQGQWNRRIRTIKQTLLDSREDRLVQEGRIRILDIKDPLAIYPLAQVLSAGNTTCRAVLVESLSTFPDDEATMNLAVMGLIDRDAGVRERALTELAQRKDPRVVAQYRQALRNGNDAILARAAAALGQLGAMEAVPDLIDALTVRRNRWVEQPVRRYFAGWPSIFYRTQPLYAGATLEVSHLPQIGVPHDAVYFESDVATEWKYRPVTVYRTEVLEALKRITGQNFGFEREPWLRWVEESKR